MGDPESVWARNRRSWILYELRRYAQAAREADAAIELDPDYSESYLRKAEAMAALGRRQEGLEILEDALRRLGNDAYLIYWYAKILADDEQYKEAERQILRNINSDAVDVYDYQLLGYIAIETSDFVKARKAVASARETGGDRAYTVYQSARLFIEDEKIDDALAEFDRAIELGLSSANVEEFVRALIGKGAFLAAIGVRARHGD